MLVSRVRKTVVERGLFRGVRGVVAGCSGGPDSVVMVHALAHLAPEFGVRLAVASVNHGLRAEAADEVEAVRAFSRSLGLPFYGLSVQVTGGGSLQNQARDARYSALFEAARDLGAEAIAVGHTRDDQAETVLARLLRGAGLEGLSAIHPRRDDGVVRPLIDCTRADVMAYAVRHDLVFCRDPSNDDAKFSRVRLRAALLPELRREDPQVDTHLADLADEAREISAHLNWLATDLLSLACRDHRLCAVAMAKEPGPVRRAALRLWVRQETSLAVGRAHLNALDRLIRKPGEVLLPAEWSAFREDAFLVVRQRFGRLTRSSRAARPDPSPPGVAHCRAKTHRD